MQTPDHVTEDQLDLLLNDLFCSNEISSSDAGIAQLVLAQEYDAVMAPARERELLQRLGKKPKGGKGWKFLPVVIIPLIVVFAWFMLYEPKKKPAHVPVIEVLPRENNAQTQTAQPVMTQPAAALPPVRRTDQAPAAQPIFSPFENTPLPVVLPGASPAPLPPVQPVQANYAEYLELKPALLKHIIGIDEKLYTRVEEGQVSYRGQNKSVDAFVIRNYAITNREYKIFLADLQQSGRTADYAVAAVQPGLWQSYQCPQLASTYFTDPRYDDFPVVNISPAAVLLYCSWLETQLRTVMVAKKSQSRKLQVRLPYDYEWIHSARVGYADIPDCGGYNTIYDPRDSLVGRSFVRRMVQVKKQDHRKPTPLDQLFAINRYGLSENEILKIYNSGLALLSDSAMAIVPGSMATGNKTGHVSEIIRNADEQLMVMGSCWSSKQVYQQMLDGFRQNNGSPFVGFRVVICNADKGSFKKPFW